LTADSDVPEPRSFEWNLSQAGTVNTATGNLDADFAAYFDEVCSLPPSSGFTEKISVTVTGPGGARAFAAGTVKLLRS
jgi:hypothetical protein